MTNEIAEFWWFEFVFLVILSVNYRRVACVTIGIGRFVRILENLLEMVEKGALVSMCSKIGLCRLLKN
jgi:hypothetical protein